ncbi:hypothetical protein BH160DRAFT_1224 [Burkholderia sp. H160]|nr:hypothetical protein BH160DRAFT_1224 [Burkholderia sp. H160]
MKNDNGQPMIRLADKTTHDGKRVSHAGDRTGCGAILVASS